MSYIINNSRGNIVAVVADGTINTTATDVALVGRAVTNYGEYQNENCVYLLENFANGTAPVQPILGQLWYNSTTDVISAYSTANTWTALASQTYVDAQKVSQSCVQWCTNCTHCQHKHSKFTNCHHRICAKQQSQSCV